MTLLYFTSCKAELDIPEGDIKEFVSAFDGEVAYQNVHYGTSVITNKRYEGKTELTGTHTSLAAFDKRDGKFYHYIETTADGSFVGENAQYQYNHRITVCYADPEDESQHLVRQVTDNVEDTIEYDLEDIVNSVKNFFYSEISAGFHTGGTYYGDYILNNISKYYDRFSLNDEKTELTFEINTVTPTSGGNEILNIHKFVVNNYGMVISVETTAYYVTNKEIMSTLVTTMKCDYVTNVEKKIEF